jgi:hypothetical protein
MTDLQQSQFDRWDRVKQFYKDKFNIEPALVDIMSEIDVLKLCATGSSNKSISKFLDLDEEFVSETISKRLGLNGWVADLPFNPFRMYKSLGAPYDLESFRNIVIISYGYQSDLEINKMYNAAGIVVNLEKLLDEQWI